MSLPKPQYIANLIVSEGKGITAATKLVDVVSLLLKEKISSMSSEERADYVEANLDNIARELFQKENDASQDGITLTYKIVQEDGAYYIEFKDSPEIKVLRLLQKKSPEDFELFCSSIITNLGANSIVTGGTDDGGVDFTGYNLKLNNLPSLSTKGSRVFVIGQAKRFSDGNHITLNDLRVFIGACVKKIDEYKKTRADQFGIFQPIILCYWTTTDFHTLAKKYANELGLWYLNGVALAQLAIDLNIIPTENI